MRVAELKAALAAVPDDLEVVVRAADDENDQWIVCGVAHVGVDHGCADVPFLGIEASTDVVPEVDPDSDECDECDDSGTYLLNGEPQKCICSEPQS